MARNDSTRRFQKAEPSRWHTNTPGHYPSYSGHKLRAMAASGLGELNALQARAAQMQRTEPEDPTRRTPAHVVVIEDVTRGLGLDLADVWRIDGLVSGTSAEFTQKTQTQRLMHARGRLLEVMRTGMKHVPADIREELLRRATAYWRRNQQTDYGKEPTVRFGGGAMRKGPTPVLFLGSPPTEPGAIWVVPLRKAAARGGKYYRRVATGNPKRPWKYYYTRAAYEKEHGQHGEKHGQQSLFDADRLANTKKLDSLESEREAHMPESIPDKAEVTSAAIADYLEQIGGKRWAKGDHDRVYLSSDVAAELIGLEVSRYGTGNVSYAALNGEKISNTRARRILQSIDGAWMDVRTGEFNAGRYGDADWLEEIEEGARQGAAAAKG